MPPLPKRKLSKGRRDRRRSHLALATPNLVECPQCHKMRRPHHVCGNCGYYGTEEVVAIPTDRKKK